MWNEGGGGCERGGGGGDGSAGQRHGEGCNGPRWWLSGDAMWDHLQGTWMGGRTMYCTRRASQATDWSAWPTSRSTCSDLAIASWAKHGRLLKCCMRHAPPTTRPPSGSCPAKRCSSCAEHAVLFNAFSVTGLAMTLVTLAMVFGKCASTGSALNEEKCQGRMSQVQYKCAVTASLIVEVPRHP